METRRCGERARYGMAVWRCLETATSFGTVWNGMENAFFCNVGSKTPSGRAVWSQESSDYPWAIPMRGRGSLFLVFRERKLLILGHIPHRRMQRPEFPNELEQKCRYGLR